MTDIKRLEKLAGSDTEAARRLYRERRRRGEVDEALVEALGREVDIALGRFIGRRRSKGLKLEILELLQEVIPKICHANGIARSSVHNTGVAFRCEWGTNDYGQWVLDVFVECQKWGGERFECLLRFVF